VALATALRAIRPRTPPAATVVDSIAAALGHEQAAAAQLRGVGRFGRAWRHELAAFPAWQGQAALSSALRELQASPLAPPSAALLASGFPDLLERASAADAGVHPLSEGPAAEAALWLWAAEHRADDFRAELRRLLRRAAPPAPGRLLAEVEPEARHAQARDEGDDVHTLAEVLAAARSWRRRRPPPAMAAAPRRPWRASAQAAHPRPPPPPPLLLLRWRARWSARWCAPSAWRR